MSVREDCRCAHVDAYLCDAANPNCPWLFRPLQCSGNNPDITVQCCAERALMNDYIFSVNGAENCFSDADGGLLIWNVSVPWLRRLC
jgi:hypothetical protein